MSVGNIKFRRARHAFILAHMLDERSPPNAIRSSQVRLCVQTLCTSRVQRVVLLCCVHATITVSPTLAVSPSLVGYSQAYF